MLKRCNIQRNKRRGRENKKTGHRGGNLKRKVMKNHKCKFLHWFIGFFFFLISSSECVCVALATNGSHKYRGASPTKDYEVVMSERAEADRDLNNDRNLNSYNNAATGAGSRRFELPDGNQTGRGGGGVVGGVRRIFLFIESFWPTANALLRKVEIHVVASFSFMEITSIIIYTQKKRIIF